jgi:hypothetical protein
VELYRQRLGDYLADVMGDIIYCNCENRLILKAAGNRLVSKQLGHPSEKKKVEYNLGDRNPNEGKFVQWKVKYWMDRIKVRHKDTS